jgi:cytosine/adenosine deaminase-related metal-dependent hydrolase
MADIIIRGGYVVTMDVDIPDLPQGDVYIHDDRIVEVADHIDVSGAEVIDARGCVVTPGFIDGHRHVWCGLLRGARKADWGNWTLPEYMVEARSMYCGCFGADDEYVANYFGGLESLNAGITSVVDHSHLQKSPDVSDALARGLKDSGVGGFFVTACRTSPISSTTARPTRTRSGTCSCALPMRGTTKPPPTYAPRTFEWPCDSASRCPKARRTFQAT